MARSPRDFYPGVAYHLISRFVNREWFIDTDSKRSGYLALLGDALKRSDWSCLGYAVMSNHIHLACVAGEQPFDDWIRRAHAPFAEWVNDTRDRIGAVFARGPKSITIANDTVCTVLAYLHNNPVRAGISARARDTGWTSHRAYLGLERVPPWLHVDEGYARFGCSDANVFDRWVSDPDIDHVDRVRACAHPDTPRANISMTPALLVEAIAKQLDLPAAFITESRTADASFAREVAACCAAELGMTGVSIAGAVGVSAQAMSRLRRRGTRDVHAIVERVLRATEHHASVAG